MDEVRLGSRTLQPGRQLLVAGRREPLGKRALDILSVLAEARGAIVTKDELLEAVWPGIVVEENALQVHVVALRKALGPEADRLKTIRGVGYQLDVDGGAKPDGCSAPSVPAASATPELQRESGGISPPAPATVTPGRQLITSRAVSWMAKNRWAVLIAAALAVIAGTWALFGSELGLGRQERIALVIRELAPSGAGGQTEAALASGITDELIVRLRRMPELRIGSAEAKEAVNSRVFTNAYVLDGNIRGVGDRVRVTARFANAEGEILWSQTFDRTLVDLFEVQEAIAASISDALGVSLDVGSNSVAYGGTDDPEAFAAYLKYKAHTFDVDQRVPMRHLERALSIDPNYIKALAGVATSYGIQSNLAPTREQALQLLAKMDASTARAVATNRDLWIGHAARGNYFNERRDYASAAKSFQRVAQLDKGVDPELRYSLAIYAFLNGRVNRSLELLDSIEAIDPISRFDPLRIWLLARQGRNNEAIELFEKLSARDPGKPLPYADYVFWAYLELGQEDNAIQFAERYNVLWLEAMRDFKAEKTLPGLSSAELRQWADKRYGGAGHFQLANMAIFAGHYGHPRLSLDLLRLAFERPGGYAVNALWFPALSDVRKTEEFATFLANQGLVKLWRETDDWPDACRPVSARKITCT